MSETGVVIRTYNESAMLPRTLEALFGQSEQSFRIVLVDSGSTDTTLEIARRYDRIKIIEIPKRDFTYGRALNIGIAAIADRVDYIALLSAHAVPCNENWLHELLTPMLNDPRIAGVYGKQVPWPAHLSNPVVRVLASDSYPQCYGEQAFITNSSYFFSNANCAIRSSFWFNFKFSETMPACEDWLWAKSVIQAGGWIAYQPSAVVYHSHSDTFKMYLVRHYREEIGFRLVDPDKYPVISRRQCLQMVKRAVLNYWSISLKDGKLYGLHWNQLIIDLIRAVAAYKGRKDARIAA